MNPIVSSGEMRLTILAIIKGEMTSHHWYSRLVLIQEFEPNQLGSLR
jgi:hypothetical protein